MINEIKTYSFFKKHETIKDIKGKYSYFNLSDLNILDIKVSGKYIYLSCRIKRQKKSLNNIQSTESSIFQIQHSKIISEFNNIYNKNIFDFKTLLIDSISYLVTLGTDFKEVAIGNDRTFLMIPSVKVFPTSLNLNNQDDSITDLINTINLMKYINKDELYDGNDYIRNIEPITNINCFDVSDDGNYIGIGLEKGEIIIIKDIFERKNDNKNNIFLLPKATIDNITNLLFWKNSNNSIILYMTTVKELYYYELNNKTFSQMNSDFGALKGCISLDKTLNKIILVSPFDNSIGELINFEKGGCWLLEGKKSNLQLYKNNIVFIANNSKIIVYDPNNKLVIFNQEKEENENILNIFSFSERNLIYCLKQSKNNEEKSIKEIIVYKEIHHDYKLEQFYNNKDYNLALKYVKQFPNLFRKDIKYEIIKKNGDYYASKGDYKNAINEYIKTINYYNPTEIICNLLDGSKMDFLIVYLEEINKKDFFIMEEKRNYYISLLINCYIKQKKFKKLKEFIDKAYLNKQTSIIRNVINICKETNQVELAMTIVEKGKINDIKIEVLIEMKEDYNQAIDLLIKEKNILKQFELTIKYGDLLFEKNKEKMLKLIYQILNHLINIKNGKEVILGNQDYIEKVKKLNYDDLINLVILDKYENIRENILNFIIENDKNCNSKIIIGKIEISLVKFKEFSKEYINDNNNLKNPYIEDIINILKNKNKLAKIDKNYLMTLFITYNFQEGIIYLNEILNDQMRLLQIYMENQNYEKILNICDSYGLKNNDIYFQSLYYFIKTYSKDNSTEKYIDMLLARLYEKGLLTTIAIVEISKKLQNKMKFGIIRKYISNVFKDNLVTLDTGKKERDQIFEQYNKIKRDIESLKRKKTFEINKNCNTCNQKLLAKDEIICFCCNHSFHQLCYKNFLEVSNIEEDICPQCVNKNNQLSQRMKQSIEQSNNHNNFFIELHSKPKKFELITKYLGKGIFKFN